MSKQHHKMIYGFHAVTAVLTTRPELVTSLALATARDDRRAHTIIKLADQNAIAIQRMSTRDMTAALEGVSLHQGVVAYLREAIELDDNDLLALVAHQMDAGTPPLLVMLDHVQDPHNLGAIMRSAEALGAHAVIAPKRNSAHLTPAARKVASGADALVPFIQVTNLARTLDKLAEVGVWRVGLTEHAENDLTTIDMKGPIVLVMGSEGSGLRRNTKSHCDFLGRIPLQGSTSSLNVSVAAGIALYQVDLQRRGG